MLRYPYMPAPHYFSLIVANGNNCVCLLHIFPVKSKLKELLVCRKLHVLKHIEAVAPYKDTVFRRITAINIWSCYVIVKMILKAISLIRRCIGPAILYGITIH